MTHTFLVAVTLSPDSDPLEVANQIEDALDDAGELTVNSVKPWSEHLTSTLSPPASLA